MLNSDCVLISFVYYKLVMCSRPMEKKWILIPQKVHSDQNNEKSAEYQAFRHHLYYGQVPPNNVCVMSMRVPAAAAAAAATTAAAACAVGGRDHPVTATTPKKPVDFTLHHCQHTSFGRTPSGRDMLRYEQLN